VEISTVHETNDKFSQGRTTVTLSYVPKKDQFTRLSAKPWNVTHTDKQKKTIRDGIASTLAAADGAIAAALKKPTALRLKSNTSNLDYAFEELGQASKTIEEAEARIKNEIKDDGEANSAREECEKLKKDRIEKAKASLEAIGADVHRLRKEKLQFRVYIVVAGNKVYLAETRNE
jgi:hypothetical protein